MTNMFELFKPGDRLFGFCNGYFGRDDYANKICVAVRPQYALFEYVDGGEAVILNASECRALDRKIIEEWMEDEYGE